MTWQFVFRQTYTVEPKVDSVRLPILFQPYHRLILRAVPLTGVGVNERFLGTLSQLLFVDGFGDVKGDILPLPSGYLLLVPTSEFTYRLQYQPSSKQFSFELSIWIDSVALQPGTSAPLPTVDLSPLEASITLLSSGQGSILTDVTAIQSELTTIIDGETSIVAYLVTMAAQLAALVTSNNQIRAVLSLPTPTPTPTPAPMAQAAVGVAYVATQNTLRLSNNFFRATYANLTDSDQTTGGVTEDGTVHWIQATWPALVTVTAITLSGGRLDGYGDSDGPQNGAIMQYSTDNATWINLFTVSGIPGNTVSGPKTLRTVLTSPVQALSVRIYKESTNQALAVPALLFE